MRLRDDLLFRPCSEQTGYWILEDPQSGRFFRLGPAEYAAIQDCQGDGIKHWLSANGLCAGSQPPIVTNGKPLALKLLQFRVKIPLADRYFDFAHSYLRSVFSLPGHCLFVLVASVGIYIVGSQWRQFTASAAGFIAPDNWLLLALAWLFLKVLHETAHGIVCVKYGGHVRETGIQFVLLAPLVYVDVTSCWRFPFRWQRMHVAIAGIYTELWCAAMAAIAWGLTNPGWMQRFTSDLVLLAGVGTLAFNINPLMRFDGYYLLSDLLGANQLYQRGIRAAASWLRSLFLGSSIQRHVEPSLIGYGIAVIAWRFAVTVGLSVAVARWGEGAGVPLAMLAIWAWCIWPAWRSSLEIVRELISTGRLLAGLTRTLAIILCLLVVFAIVPTPWGGTAPGVIEFADTQRVRVESPGFLHEICVAPGQTVVPGEVLFRLENTDLRKDLIVLECEYQQSLFRCRQLELKGERAAQQGEEQIASSLLKRIEGKKEQIGQLQVRSHSAGKVIARQLEALRGTYCETGMELALVVSGTEKMVRLSIDERDVEQFLAKKSEPIRITLPCGAKISGKLEQVNPRASTQLIDVRLASAHGGPILVRQREKRTTSDQGLESLQPRFEGRVMIDPADASIAFCGQVASVQSARHQTILNWIIGKTRYPRLGP